MEQQLTTSAIYAALDASGILEPVDIYLDDEEIVISWSDADASVATSAHQALQEHGLNYDDPRPGTVDLRVEITQGGRKKSLTVATITRCSNADYNVALDELRDAQAVQRPYDEMGS